MEGKRQVMANNASEIIKYLYNVIGCDNFVTFIKLLVDEGTIDQKMATNLTKPFVQQKEKRDRSSFLELVKEQRKHKSGSGKVETVILAPQKGLGKENAMVFGSNHGVHISHASSPYKKTV